MSNHFVRGLKHYKYEVKKMFIFDEYLSFEGIKAIGFKPNSVVRTCCILIF